MNNKNKSLLKHCNSTTRHTEDGRITATITDEDVVKLIGLVETSADVRQALCVFIQNAITCGRIEV